MQRRALLAATGLLVAPAIGRAQSSYPGTRPVRIIMPSTPGTPQDLYSRHLAEHWGRTLGGTFVVENRPGASGTIGLAHVANSAPDGYTLTFNSNTAQTISPQVMRDVGFDAMRSFAPVMLAYKYGMFLLINPAIPARTTQEFFAWAKAKRGGVNMASVGLGSGGQLMGERIKLRGGFPAEPIHYRGSPPALLAVSQGECDYIMDNVGASAPLRKDGKLRGLSLTGSSRASDAPEIPTLAEEGIAGFDEEIWFGISAPAGTPRPIIDRLNAEANRWLRSDFVRERMNGFSHQPMGGTPEDFAAFAAQDLRIWSAVVKETGVRAE
jgi:tripartite-type tricarboxylate transporter receptor subunit TctC